MTTPATPAQYRDVCAMTALIAEGRGQDARDYLATLDKEETAQLLLCLAWVTADLVGWLLELSNDDRTPAALLREMSANPGQWPAE